MEKISPPLTHPTLVSIGIDCCAVDRMQSLLERRPLFFQSLTSSQEQAHHPPSLARALMLWTGKEAVSKALKTGVWQANIEWKDLQIMMNQQVILSGQAKQFSKDRFDLDFEIKDGYGFARVIRWMKNT
jgi:phosphopantetheinyl transferase (holo-ACP synthase)